MNHKVKQYVEEHKASKSRYDIDKFLLSKGHNAQEIEAVWMDAFKSPAPPPLLKRRSIKAFAFFFSLLLLGASLFSWIHSVDDVIFFENEGDFRFVSLTIELAFLVGVLIWKGNQKYNPPPKSLALFLATLSVGVALPILLLSTAIYYTIGAKLISKNVASLTVNGYDYHLDVSAYSGCSWEDCSTTYTIHRCKVGQSPCPVDKTETTYNSDYNSVIRGEIKFKYDINTNKVYLNAFNYYGPIYNIDAG